MANSEITLSDKDITRIREHAANLKSLYSERDNLLKECEDAYMMKWTGKPNHEGIRATISPDIHNALQGLVRLMITTDPVWKVDSAYATGIEKQVSEKIEKAAGRIWLMASKQSRVPVLNDLILSAMLYGQFDCAITRTDDIAAAASKDESKSRKNRIKRANKRTPYIYTPWNPRQGYPEYDELGLCGYYREVDMTVRQVLNKWGEAAKGLEDDHSFTDTVPVGIWYDLDNYAAWAGGKTLSGKLHDLPFIPVVVQQIEGSQLFSQPEEQTHPFLYATIKSGYWDRQNLSMTVLYFLIENFGLSPLYVHNVPESMADKGLKIDFSEGFGVVHTVGAESLMPMQSKGLIDPAVQQGIATAESKIMESTVYRQVLGAPPSGGGIAFSTVNLLSQQGRLPLTAPQRLGGWGLAQIMETSMEWIRQEGGKYEWGDSDLRPSDIPDNLQIDCSLDVHLPQDKLQLANIVNILTAGPDPKVSKQWARKEILGIENDQEMQDEIWTEVTNSAKHQVYIQQMIEAAKQAQQQGQLSPEGQQMPMGGQGSPVPGPGGQLPPELMQLLENQQLQGQGQGQPMMPPEMMPGAQGEAGPTMAPGQGQMIQGMPPQQGGMMPGQGYTGMEEGG